MHTQVHQLTVLQSQQASSKLEQKQICAQQPHSNSSRMPGIEDAL
jgi:hypothetical protein